MYESVDELIISIRDLIGDARQSEGRERYTDDQIVRECNEALYALQMMDETIFRGDGVVTLEEGADNFTLPDNAIGILSFIDNVPLRKIDEYTGIRPYTDDVCDIEVRRASLRSAKGSSLEAVYEDDGVYRPYPILTDPEPKYVIQQCDTDSTAPSYVIIAGQAYPTTGIVYLPKVVQFKARLKLKPPKLVLKSTIPQYYEDKATIMYAVRYYAAANMLLYNANMENVNKAVYFNQRYQTAVQKLTK